MPPLLRTALLCGTGVADGRVTPLLAVEDLDVVEQLGLGGVAVFEVAQLSLQVENQLLAIASTAHAADDVVLFEPLSIVFAGVRAALVGMVQQPRIGATTSQRHVERPDREVTIVLGGDGPADHESREQVHVRRQVPVGAARPKVPLGGVAHPALIGRLCSRLSSERIGRHGPSCSLIVVHL